MTAVRRAIAVIDLGFGDAGKGTTIDALARRTQSTLTVRFNGGPQAGHNVLLPDGRHHTFSQFASNTFVPGARTLLSEAMLIEPYAMINEAEHLEAVGIEQPFQRLMIDRHCRVISPPQQAANQLRELARGTKAHGTCGRGVGECVADDLADGTSTIRAADLENRDVLRKKLNSQVERKWHELGDALILLRSHPAASRAVDVLEDLSWIDIGIDNYAWLAQRIKIVDDAQTARLIGESQCVLFEGAQGVLLDQDFGFHPHTTWSSTTFANVDSLLNKIGFDGERVRWGVTRCYQTRHGAGPFVSEWNQNSNCLSEPHNTSAGWQGRFRAGHFDAVMIDYAIACVGRLDGFAITHVDRLPELPGGVCVAYNDAKSTARTDQNHPLRVLPASDLVARRRLTDLLSRCRPEIDDSITPDRLVDWINDRFGVPTIVRSTGPTWQDKRWSEDESR